jgi:hypothetical protein
MGYSFSPSNQSASTVCPPGHTPDVACPDEADWYNDYGCRLSGVGEEYKCVGDNDNPTRQERAAVGVCKVVGGEPVCDVEPDFSVNPKIVFRYKCAPCN